MTTFKHNGLYLTFGGSYLTQPTPDLAFRILVDTTKDGSASNTMIIPTNGTGYDFSIDWGDGTIENISGTTPTTSHVYSSGGEYEIAITGVFQQIRFNNGGDKLKLLQVLNWGCYGLNGVDQNAAFTGCSNLIKIADDFDYMESILINGVSMFSNCGLTSLPVNLKLNNLVNGATMFANNSISSLPENMSLNSLTTGISMFRYNPLLSLPEVMELSSLTSCASMFRDTDLTTLPTLMTLDSITVCYTMFYNTPITSIANLSLNSMTDGDMIFNSTINTEEYSNLLIKMQANNVNTGVRFGAGTSKYNPSAITARNALVARGWTIIDGGLVT